MYEKLDNVASNVIDNVRKEIAYSMFASNTDKEDFIDDGDEEDYEENYEENDEGEEE